MDYENFKENFVEALKEELYEKGAEVNITDNEVKKLNHSGYDGIVVTPVDSRIGVTLNTDALYKAFEDGATMDEVVAKAADMTINGVKEQPNVDIATLTDYSQMKDKLAMEIVSAEANADMLANVPHKNMEDMAIVYRFVVDHNEKGSATILVTNNLIEAMGVTPEQLHADALENAPKIRPAELTGMSEMMVQMMGREQAEAMGIIPDDPSMEQMYVATTADKVNGAGVIAYKDFMDQAAMKIGGDFYVIPSSRHEVIIVPDNGLMGLEELKNMVKEVNANEVAPEDKLTDSVYHYDSKEKIFELGEKFVERENSKDAAEKSEEKASVLDDLKAKKEDVAKQPKKDAVDKAKNKTKGGDAI